MTRCEDQGMSADVSSGGPAPTSAAAAADDRKVALLRGINVGKGARIAMGDLAACTEAAGCTRVRTVLATGNVMFIDPRPGSQVRAALESAYAERFGYDAVVQVLARDAVRAAVESYPFETLPEHHDYVVFSDDAGTIDTVVRAMTAELRPDGTEAVAAGQDWVYWRVPRGSTLASPAGKVLDARQHKRHLTTRNIKTLRRILGSA